MGGLPNLMKLLLLCIFATLSINTYACKTQSLNHAGGTVAKTLWNTGGTVTDVGVKTYSSVAHMGTKFTGDTLEHLSF